MNTMKQKEKTGLKTFLSSANLTLFLILILIFFSISLARQTIKYLSISRQIADLEKDIKNLEEKNLELSGSLKYLDSKFYQEKEARLKFGLQKPGEKVIIITPPEAQQRPEILPNGKESSNFIKWLRYFFK